MEATEWRRLVGTKLERARKARKLSKRAAAGLAGISEGLWRQLESGRRQVNRDVVVPVSPKDETLVAAARAVGLDPSKLLASAGRTYDPGMNGNGNGDPYFTVVSGNWADIPDEDRHTMAIISERFAAAERLRRRT